MTEDCDICRATVPFSETVHLLIHTQSDAGVVDYYVCKRCYEDELTPLLGEPATA